LIGFRIVQAQKVMKNAATSAHGRGDFGRAAELLDPVAARITEIGGSDAQDDLFRLAYFTALVVPAAAIDLKHRIIPDAINIPGAVLVYATAVAAQPDRWAELLVGGLAGLVFLGAAWVVSPKGMGLGDVKMVLMIGLALGKYIGVALFAAFTLSLIPSLGLLLVKGLRARKIGFPFGPFLAFGAVVGLMWGEQIWNWYMLG